ncbi:uncharacterized protein LOC108114396 isoform X1 [Drosophila eugracilis]|uniref:uncharacterized protein LOC108114396 isoform X1 n=1 Tax=Drosophila eugracilis TaxID=29029 RepID=UPI0007E76F0B|nr:uncharacterized protein LOC108114396 isoform X1 [Drosophila eugracilis]
MIAEFPRSTTNVNCEKRKSRESEEAENLTNESRKGVKSISCDVGKARKFSQKKRSKKQQQQQQQEAGRKGEEKVKEPQQQEKKNSKKLCQKQGVKDKKKNQQRGENDKKKQQQKRSNNKKKKPQQQQRANNKTQQHPVVHSKKSLILFLDYLRQCCPAEIEIVAVKPTGCSDVRGSGCNHATCSKYAAKNGTWSHFEHKTKIYALYRHLEIGGPLEQVQQQQQLRVGQNQIRLRFEMLFAEPPPPPTQGHAPTSHGHAHTVDDVQDSPPGDEQVIPMLQDQQNGELMAVNYNSKAVLTPPQPPPRPPPPPQANNNNKAILECVNFMAETNKVRLLRGYLYAGELRQLTTENQTACQELSLQPFWQSSPLLVKIGDGGSFKLQEQFAIINDERFLQSVERQQLILELRPLGGVVRLPLHQFFIAYRDANITNHLCKGKLPVISIDGWAPIVSAETQSPLGELKVLLAIGSESQIAQLKQQRGFDRDNNQVPTPSSTTDLLDMLQNAITAPKPSGSVQVMPPPPAPPAPSNFSFQLRIVGAAGLPLNPGYGKSKKQVKRQSAAKRFPPNEPPNTYVTFQAINCNSQTYKSHEGLVYATPIVPRSTKPQWLSKFRVEVSRDYRSNPQKLFILKLWKKAIVSPNGVTEPSPHEDAIIGFAALNLNQKQPGGGFPSGWHNIVDFNGRVTGGIEAHVEPIPPSVDTVIDQFEKSMELGHLQLGQAIKRKYTELEEISQRLRSRLVDVTGETLKFPEFDVDSALDSWQQDGDDDDLAEDFERSLRTPTPPPDSPTPSTSNAAQNLRNTNGQE